VAETGWQSVDGIGGLFERLVAPWVLRLGILS
jgi:hypothetical protein